MALKVVDFNEYSNNELFRIKKNLDGTIANLPEEIQNYINGDNSGGSTVATKIFRCHRLIDIVIVERFMVGIIK